MQSGYEAPDIDTESALRQVGAAQESFVAFTSIRALTSGAGTLTTGTRTAKPASAALNDFYYETDTYWLYYWSGTGWQWLTGMNAGTDAARAAITVSAKDEGAYFWARDTGKLWQVVVGVWTDRFTSLDLTTSLKIAATKVIGPQETGWTAGTGTANKGAYATYAGQTVSVGYVQAEAQATDDATKANSQRIKALEDMARAHGLIN